MGIDRFNPLIKGGAFGLFFRRILSFGFQNKHVTVCESYEEVRAILVDYSIVQIGNLKAKMIVLRPCLHIVIVFYLKGL